MRSLTYLAIFEPSADGYGVFFPDLPGCISFGKNIFEAKKNAREALELHLCGMEKDNDPIPDPSTQLSPEYTEGGIVATVTIFPNTVK